MGIFRQATTKAIASGEPSTKEFFFGGGRFSDSVAGIIASFMNQQFKQRRL